MQATMTSMPCASNKEAVWARELNALARALAAEAALQWRRSPSSAASEAASRAVSFRYMVRAVAPNIAASVPEAQVWEAVRRIAIKMLRHHQRSADAATERFPGLSDISGMSDMSGMSGMSGIPGIPGMSGVPGMSGIPGMSGVPGIPGMQCMMLRDVCSVMAGLSLGETF
jgi:hypothetical protein